MRNVLIKPPDLFSKKQSPGISEGFEEVTEVMAERLAGRVPKFLKKLDALQEKTGASQRVKIELQKLLDKENKELLNLQATIRERKRLYLDALSKDDRSRLASRHPVWISDFNIYFDQIRDLFAVHKDEREFVKCILEEKILNALRIFRYVSDGDAICVNSHKSLEYVSNETHMTRESEEKQYYNDPYPWGEYIFRPVAGGHAQWTFTGNRWGLEDHILWLDFGKHRHV